MIAPQEAADARAAATARRTCRSWRSRRARRTACRSSRSTRSQGARPRPSTCSSSATATVWHIAGPPDWLEAQQRVERLARRRSRAAGAEPPRSLLGDWSPRSGYELGRELAANPDVTAVFVANDQMALGLLRALHEAGRESRRTSASSGFDDIPEAAYFTPPLTTVRQDFNEMGRASCTCCSRRSRAARARRAGRPCAPELIVRASTPVLALFALTSARSSQMLDQRDVSANIPRHVRRRRRLRDAVGARGRGARSPTARSSARPSHEYPHGVIDDGCPPRARSCRRTGRCRTPRTGSSVLRDAVPGRGRGRRRRRRARSSASRPTSPPRRRCPCSPTARRCAELRRVRASARTRTRSCGSTTPRSRRPTASTRSPPSAASRGWPATAGASRPSGSSPRRCRCSRRTREIYDAHASAGSRPPTGSSGSSAARETRNVCTAGYKGDPPGRPLPVARTTCARSTPASPTSSATSSSTPLSPLGARAGALTREAAGWTGAARGHRGRGRQRRRARHRAGRPARSSPGQMLAVMGTSTCHVMNGDRSPRCPGMCGVVDGGIMPGLWGYEAGQSGVGDIFGWFVDHARAAAPTTTRRASAASSLHEHLSELAARAGGRRARAGRARLAQRQPLRARRPRAERR